MEDEFTKMLRLMEFTADQGPPQNPEKCNTLGQDIFELKTKKLRTGWFWDKGFVMIFTHGWLKKSKKAPPGEIDRAVIARARYLQAKTDKTLTTLDSPDEFQSSRIR